MKNEISSKQKKSVSKNISERNKAKEAKARRKVNEDWQQVEKTGKYRKAVARSARKSTTNKIAMEVLDGIFLNLNPRNNDKSPSEQKKILRRIVENDRLKPSLPKQENVKTGKLRLRSKITQAIASNTYNVSDLRAEHIYLSPLIDINIQTKNRKRHGNNSSDSSGRKGPPGTLRCIRDL